MFDSITDSAANMEYGQGDKAAINVDFSQTGRDMRLLTNNLQDLNCQPNTECVGPPDDTSHWDLTWFWAVKTQHGTTALYEEDVQLAFKALHYLSSLMQALIPFKKAAQQSVAISTYLPQSGFWCLSRRP